MSEDVIDVGKQLRVTLRPLRGQFVLDPALAAATSRPGPWVQGGLVRSSVPPPNRYLRIPDRVGADPVAEQEPDRGSWTLRILRQAFGPRPPLVAPVSENAVAAGVAELVETRYRVRPSGETLADRPITDVARTAIVAAAPFIQRDVLARVAGDRLWRSGWLLVQVVAVVAAMTCALAYAIVHDVRWLVVVVTCAAAVMAVAGWQVWGSHRREVGRAADLLNEVGDLAGGEPDTIDLRQAGQ